jgi:hypothetical protein
MANYQGAMAAYNSGQQRNAGMMGGLASLGGSRGSAAIKALPWAPMRSDRRLKTDIEKVGKLDNGLPVYSYKYKAGGPQHIGVMAQDVKKVNPEAVEKVGDYLAVNYAEAVR